MSLSAAASDRQGLDLFTVIACHHCEGVVKIEFIPPDAPELSGRIEVIIGPVVNRTQQ